MADVTDDEGAAAGGGGGSRIFLSARELRPRKRAFGGDLELSQMAELEDISDIEANHRYLRERVQLLFDQSKELEARVTSLMEERDGLERAIAALTEQVASQRTDLQALEERTGELRDQQKELLSGLSDFGFLLAGSPLIHNLPFAIVENWNRVFESDTSIADVLRPLNTSLRKELRTLNSILTAQGLIESNLDSGEWKIVGDADRGSNAPLIDLFRSLFEMIRDWDGENGTVNAVRMDLRAVHDRIRFCAEKLDVDLTGALSESGDAFRRLQECVSIPTALLRAYIDSLDIE